MKLKKNKTNTQKWIGCKTNSKLQTNKKLFPVSFSPQETVNTYTSCMSSKMRDSGIQFYFFPSWFMLSLKPRKQICPAGSLTPFAVLTKREDEWPLSLMCESALVWALFLWGEYPQFNRITSLGLKCLRSSQGGEMSFFFFFSGCEINKTMNFSILFDRVINKIAGCLSRHFKM